MMANNQDLSKGSFDEYTGLHNSFHLVNRPGLGWVNTHVDILKYENFDLKKVE
jgi:hypothetical protein